MFTALCIIVRMTDRADTLSTKLLRGSISIRAPGLPLEYNYFISCCITTKSTNSGGLSIFHAQQLSVVHIYAAEHVVREIPGKTDQMGGINEKPVYNTRLCVHSLRTRQTKARFSCHGELMCHCQRCCCCCCRFLR